jgi:hypothetical protein
MVRRRWAVAVVLLLALVLLNLFAPQQAPHETAAVVAARMDVAPGDGPRYTEAESLTEPSPRADGTAVRRAALRPARTAGAAGAGCALSGAPVREPAAGRAGTAPRGAVTVERPAPGGPPPGTDLLQTFRC